MAPLKYPLDPITRRAIERTIEEFTNRESLDKTWDDYFRHTTHFDSKDGMTENLSPGATATLTTGGLALSTDATPDGGESARVHKSRPSDSRFDYKSPIRFLCTVAFVTVADQEILMICGSTSAHSFGFILDDAVLSGLAQTGSGSQTKITLDSSVTADQFYVLDARFFPTTGKVEYRVDGVLKGVVQATLPTANNTILWSMSVLTDNTTQKAFTVWDIDIYQRRF